MATKMKGIYKGFKFISHLFVVKEREIEIGFPTDVKHVAHIGLDGPDGSPPSWMNEFKAGPDFSLSSLGSVNGSKCNSVGGSRRDTTWTSQDFDGSVRRQQTDILHNFPPTNLSSASKKKTRKKGKSPSSARKSDSSPRSGSSRSRRSNLGKETESANT